MAGVGVRFEALTKGALRLRTDAQIAEARAFVQAHLERIQREVQPYPPVPPVPPNSKYKRTGKLLGSWSAPRVNVSGSSIQGTFTVRAKYAPYVVGNWQVWYHAAHGWKKLSDFLHRDEYNAGLRAIYRRMRVTT